MPDVTAFDWNSLWGFLTALFSAGVFGAAIRFGMFLSRLTSDNKEVREMVMSASAETQELRSIAKAMLEVQNGQSVTLGKHEERHKHIAHRLTMLEQGKIASIEDS